MLLIAAPEPAAAKTLLKTLDDAEQLAHKVHLQLAETSATLAKTATVYHRTTCWLAVVLVEGDVVLQHTLSAFADQA